MRFGKYQKAGWRVYVSEAEALFLLRLKQTYPCHEQTLFPRQLESYVLEGRKLASFLLDIVNGGPCEDIISRHS